MTRGVYQFGESATDFFNLIAVNAIEKRQSDRARGDLLCHRKSLQRCPTFVNRLKVNRGEVSTDANPSQMHFPHEPVPMKLCELRPQPNNIDEPAYSPAR